MRILLVRHGQDEDNAEGVLNGRRDRGLTVLGKSQALMVAEDVKKWRDKYGAIKQIFSSPLKRALETAQIIAEKLDQDEVVVDADLIERDFGEFEGKSKVDILNMTEDVLVVGDMNYFLSGNGVEEFPALLERARRFVEKLRREYLDETVVVVTHGDMGKMLRAAFYDLGWEDGLKRDYIPNAEIIELH